MKKLILFVSKNLCNVAVFAAAFAVTASSIVGFTRNELARASNEFKSLPRLKHDWSFSELFPILRIGRWFQWQNN